jgi:hypothetical protein
MIRFIIKLLSYLPDRVNLVRLSGKFQVQGMDTKIKSYICTPIFTWCA